MTLWNYFPLTYSVQMALPSYCCLRSFLFSYFLTFAILTFSTQVAKIFTRTLPPPTSIFYIHSPFFTAVPSPGLIPLIVICFLLEALVYSFLFRLAILSKIWYNVPFTMSNASTLHFVSLIAHSLIIIHLFIHYWISLSNFYDFYSF